MPNAHACLTIIIRFEMRHNLFHFHQIPKNYVYITGCLVYREWTFFVSLRNINECLQRRLAPSKAILQAYTYNLSCMPINILLNEKNQQKPMRD